MEAVNYLSNWVTWLLAIIPVGAGAMVGYQALRKSLSDDEGVISDANTKIKHTIIGSAIGVTLSGLVTIIKAFFT